MSFKSSIVFALIMISNHNKKHTAVIFIPTQEFDALNFIYCLFFNPFVLKSIPTNTSLAPELLNNVVVVYSLSQSTYIDKIYSTKPCSCGNSIFLRKRYRFISILRTDIFNNGAISLEDKFKRK